MSLAIALATRGRAPLLMQTLATTLNNIRRYDTVLVVCADEDDTETVALVRAMAASDRRLQVSVRPREDTIAEKWNRVLEERPVADLYMPMCDDGPVITEGFDQRITEAANLFPDYIGVVTNYLENLTFPGIQVVTRRLTNLLGYLYPPYFPYWFVDHWLLDITRMIGRDAFADVKLDCATNRPPTQEMREPGWWGSFYDAMYLERRREAEAIIAALDEPDWRKEMLIRRFPLYEQHSRMINDNCRRMNQGGPADDERYARIKAKALKMLRDEMPRLEEAA